MSISISLHSSYSNSLFDASRELIYFYICFLVSGIDMVGVGLCFVLRQVSCSLFQFSVVGLGFLSCCRMISCSEYRSKAYYGRVSLPVVVVEEACELDIVMK